jgi:hypothetical protein
MADEPEQTTIEVDDRPDWLPANFKDPAELAKSYGELQSKMTRDSQELAQTKETLEAVLESMQAQPEPQQQQYDPNDLQTAWDQNPIGVVALLAQQAAQAERAAWEKEQQTQQQQAQEGHFQILEQAAENLVASRVEEWDAYKEKVGARLQANPDLLPQSALTSPASLAKALENAYKIERYEENLVNPEKTLAMQAEEQRLAKLQAQTNAGSGGRPEPAGETDEDFARSLLEASDVGNYAARMAHKGL